MIELLIESLPLLLMGAKNPVTVAIVSMIIGVPIGLLLALMRLAKVVVQKFWSIESQVIHANNLV